MVQRVYEGEGGGAVERPSVIEGSGDADRGLVCIGNAEVDLTHDAVVQTSVSVAERAENGGVAGALDRGSRDIVTIEALDERAYVYSIDGDVLESYASRKAKLGENRSQSAAVGVTVSEVARENRTTASNSGWRPPRALMEADAGVLDGLLSCDVLLCRLLAVEMTAEPSLGWTASDGDCRPRTRAGQT